MNYFCLCVLLAAAAGVSSRPSVSDDYDSGYIDVDYETYDDGTISNDPERHNTHPPSTTSSTTEIPAYEIELEPLDFNPVVSNRAGPAVHLPTNTFVDLDRLEKRIHRGLKAAREKSEKIDQRVTSLFKNSINGLRKDMAQLAKITQIKFEVVRQEIEKQNKNTESLRRELISQNAKHDKEFKTLSQRVVKGFSDVDRDIVDLFGRIRSLTSKHRPALLFNSVELTE